MAIGSPGTGPNSLPALPHPITRSGAAAPALAKEAVALLDLPPFPGVAIKALQLVSNNDSRLRELHYLISADPALSAALLRMANSPLYAIRSEIQSTLQATILMGFERVRALVLTIAMKSYVGSSLTVPELHVCWRHSLACAMIAEDLAMAIFIDKDVAYTAGLLHDVGRLALAVLRPETYAGLIKTARDSSDDLLQLERQTFGFDHCQAGQSLIAAWNLPAHFTVVTGEHHDVKKRSVKPLGVLQVVALSCAIADAIGFAVAPQQQPEPYDGLMSSLPVDCLHRFPADPAELAKRISDKIGLVELQ